MPTWVQQARRFIATGEPEHLDRAVESCTDAEVLAFLRNPNLQGRRQVDPSCFEALVERLIADDRLDEAGVVHLLGFRFVAAAMFELETYDAERQAFIERTCKALAKQSASARFPECEALFKGLWATGAAKLRRDAESFGLFEEALNQARSLVENAGLYASLLAGLLGNYGNALRFAGKTCDAANLLEEATNIRRRLAEGGAERSRGHLASTLSNLAAVYAAERRFGLAEPLLSEAVGIQRGLSATGSTREQRSLAGTLSNLAVVYTEQRRFHAARQASEESLGIRRRLAAKEPDAHLPDVAVTLSNYGMLLDELREHGAAVAHLREAVTIRRRLAESQPKVFAADLATSLNNLANTLLVTDEAHDIRRALEAYNEALEIRRQLADDDPELYVPAVAQTLGNIAGLRRQVGQLNTAIAQMNEVTAILRWLCNTGVDEPRHQLAGSLSNLGSTLILADRAAEAIDVIAEAVALFEQLARDEPAVFEGQLAATLNDLSLALERVGRHDEALATAERAISIAERADSHVYLAKGDTSGAYWLVISNRCRRESPEAVYDVVVALRDPDGRIGERRRAGSLAEATSALLESSRSCGKPLVVVVVERLVGDDVFFGVLAPDDEIPFRYCCVDSFAPQARELVSLVFAPFEDPAAYVYQVEETRVVAAGEDAWQALPDFVQDALHPDREHIVLLCGDADSQDLPWEACRFGRGDSDWLGLHRHLARISTLSTAALKSIRPSEGLAHGLTAGIVCPWNLPGQLPLNGALAEAGEVTGLLRCEGYNLLPSGGALMGREANVTALIDLLRLSPRLIHFCGHGEIVRGAASLILFGESPTGDDHALFDRARLLEAQVASGRERIFDTPSVVVLNSCWAGRGRDFGGQREDLAAAFLEQGASCVIACPTPVQDEVGRLLATILYAPELRDGRGMAYTFMRMRSLVERKLRGSTFWWTWLWMRYHGNPFVRLFDATPSSQGADETRDQWHSRGIDIVRHLIT